MKPSDVIRAVYDVATTIDGGVDFQAAWAGLVVAIVLHTAPADA